MNRAQICQEAIEILGETVEIIRSTEMDVVWSGYDTVDQVVSDLTDHINRLNKRDLSRWRYLELLFAPTGALQEISLSRVGSHQRLVLMVLETEQGYFHCRMGKKRCGFSIWLRHSVFKTRSMQYESIPNSTPRLWHEY